MQPYPGGRPPAPRRPVGPDELDTLLRSAPWMPEDGRLARAYLPVDHAVLGHPDGDGAPDREVLLLVVAVAGGPAEGQRYFVPVRRAADGTLHEVHRQAVFDSAAVAMTAAGGRLTTARGGTVEFRGPRPAGPPPEVRPLPFEQGWSSNALSLIELAGVPHIHKTYRRLDEPVREPDLLRRMTGTGRTPDWAGDYTYTDPDRATRHPLGVLYRYAPGEGIDTPLRESIRTLWPRLTAAEPPARTARRHLRPLEERLREAGRFLAGFHRDLADRLGGGTGPVPYPAGEALAGTEDRLRDLLGRPAVDPAVPPRVRHAALAALGDQAGRLRERFDGGAGGAAGPCHGDLHLSHLLCGPAPSPERPWRMAVIDLSTPATGPGDPRWAAQSPLQDVVALQRALEYFTADEAAFESAGLLGIDSLETMRGALLDAAGLLDTTDGWTLQQRTLLRRVYRAADAWRERVVQLLLGPGAAVTAATGPAADDPLRRLLYVRRLLHELAYNHAHARPYHAAIDLRHALLLRREPPAPARPAAARPALPTDSRT